MVGGDDHQRVVERARRPQAVHDAPDDVVDVLRLQDVSLPPDVGADRRPGVGEHAGHGPHRRVRGAVVEVLPGVVGQQDVHHERIGPAAGVEVLVVEEGLHGAAAVVERTRDEESGSLASAHLGLPEAPGVAEQELVRRPRRDRAQRHRAQPGQRLEGMDVVGAAQHREDVLALGTGERRRPGGPEAAGEDRRHRLGRHRRDGRVVAVPGRGARQLGEVRIQLGVDGALPVEQQVGGQPVEHEEHDRRRVVADRGGHGVPDVGVDVHVPVPEDDPAGRRQEHELDHDHHGEERGIPQERPEGLGAVPDQPHHQPCEPAGGPRHRHERQVAELAGDLPHRQRAEPADQSGVHQPEPGGARQRRHRVERHRAGRGAEHDDDQERDAVGPVGAAGDERLGRPAERREHRPGEDEGGQGQQLERPRPDLAGGAPEPSRRAGRPAGAAPSGRVCGALGGFRLDGRRLGRGGHAAGTTSTGRSTSAPTSPSTTKASRVFPPSWNRWGGSSPSARPGSPSSPGSTVVTAPTVPFSA